MLKSDLIADLLEQSRDEKTKDPLVIIPTQDLVKLRKSGSASIDLRLGCWFLILRRARTSFLEINSGTSELQIGKRLYVRFGDKYYLHPGSFVLGSTLEWLRLPSNLGAYITGMSRWGRRGLIIATAAGIHPGFRGCLTLELCNVGEIPIEIEPGMPICQVFFHRLEDTDSDNVDQSQFLCGRRPSLGEVKRDTFVNMLTNAY